MGAQPKIGGRGRGRAGFRGAMGGGQDPQGNEKLGGVWTTPPRAKNPGGGRRMQWENPRAQSHPKRTQSTQNPPKPQTDPNQAVNFERPYLGRSLCRAENSKNGRALVCGKTSDGENRVPFSFEREFERCSI